MRIILRLSVGESNRWAAASFFHNSFGREMPFVMPEEVNFVTYGYIRVSAQDQNEDRQLVAMREAAVPEQNIFMEKRSGKDFDRPVYLRLLSG